MKSPFPVAVALLAFSPALKAHAENAQTLIARGDLCDKHLQTHAALDAYLAAAKLTSPDAELLRRIAKEYGELMADTDSVEQKRALGMKALDYAMRSVSADPRDPLAELSMAVCYGRLAPLQDNETKIAYSRMVKLYAEKALALDPNNDLTYNVLGSWNLALASLNPFLRGLAGMIYGTLPDASYQDSVKDFQKAIQLNPNRLANYIGLGRAYAGMGKTAEARAEIERGLAMPSQEKDDPYVKAQGRETLGGL